MACRQNYLTLKLKKNNFRLITNFASIADNRAASRQDQADGGREERAGHHFGQGSHRQALLPPPRGKRRNLSFSFIQSSPDFTIQN